jgi:hypothetical protein
VFTSGFVDLISGCESVGTVGRLCAGDSLRGGLHHPDRVNEWLVDRVRKALTTHPRFAKPSTFPGSLDEEKRPRVGRTHY